MLTGEKDCAGGGAAQLVTLQTGLLLLDSTGTYARCQSPHYLSLLLSLCLTLQIKWCVINQGFPINKINQNGPVQFFLYAVSE
jgi:hypothetical protein